MLGGGGKTDSPPSEADRFLSSVGAVALISAELSRNSDASTGKAGCPPVEPSSTREWAEPVGTGVSATVLVAATGKLGKLGTTGKTGGVSPRSLKSGLSSEVCLFFLAAEMMDDTISLAKASFRSSVLVDKLELLAYIQHNGQGKSIKSATYKSRDGNQRRTCVVGELAWST